MNAKIRSEIKGFLEGFIQGMIDEKTENNFVPRNCGPLEKAP